MLCTLVDQIIFKSTECVLQVPKTMRSLTQWTTRMARLLYPWSSSKSEPCFQCWARTIYGVAISLIGDNQTTDQTN